MTMDGKPGYDVCRACRSDKLFTNYIDEEGYYDPDGAEETLCEVCGHDQDRYANGRRVRGASSGH